jgi:flagellar protein FliO/FliZ
MEFFSGMLDTRFLIGFAFIAALVLAGGLVWHRFGAGPLKAMTPRGRQPRLAVIEAASLHPGRLLVLIRRDNTEHLIMIGGPTDVVIEPNIARGGAGTGGAVREPRSSPVADVPARPSPLDDRPGWPPPIEPPLRVARPLDPLLGEPERLEPPLRAPRESIPVEPVARMARTEPAVRAPPPVPTERFLAEFDDDGSDEPALIPPPPPPPAPPEHPPMVSEPRRPQVQPVPPPPAYEPSFQPAPPPAAERRATTVPPPPPPPPLAAPAEAPAFQRAPEPRRMAARPMAAPPPPPPPPPPPEPAESALEAAWMQASAAPPAAQDLDQPAARHSPVLQSTVMTEARRAQTVPPKPTQNDESNLAEMAQRLEAALRRPIKPVEPAPPPVPVRAPPPTAPAANPAARVEAYFDPPATTRSAAGRAQEPPPAPVLKVVPAQEKSPSLEEEMASLLGRSQGKT